MADLDDGAPLQAPGEFTSDALPADQSLSTATLKLEPGDSSTGTDESRTRSAEPSCDRLAASEPTAEELERAALCLEIARVREALEEADCEVEEADAGDDVASTLLGNEHSDTIAYRVIDFHGGTYRGQVQVVNDDWQPHGLGVLTTATGCVCSGQWLNGTQVNHGTRYSPTLRYEGDMSVANCHGVGLYTFGALFIGCWNTAADGWFHGLRCIHPSPSETECIFQLSRNTRSQPQPQRGLMVADEKIQFWHRYALIRALRRWSRLCCEFSITQARTSRLLAFQTQAQARQAEQRANNEHVERQKAAKSNDVAEVLALLAKSRESQEQRHQRQQLYVQRLANAIKQRDLAQVCVTKQESALKTLELELQEIAAQVTEARQAQEDCAQRARELQLLQRQIENLSVNLNAARFDQKRQMKSPQEHDPELRVPQHSAPPTPVTKTPREQQDTEDDNQHVARGRKFVCDVPGCSCGIPRDVFVRVAAAFNDD
ncbi:hypothetical protein PHMEG_0001991 [Phytophthora megakarya]|uniref:Uncharacterized protein n=1 Tax=Phytophthora megakarya TaxID=4795 RepID=A0A225WZP7_9STRA|nr:hypothetical protein PHMEG_0001991 [Phytophthora megakarya]